MADSSPVSGMGKRCAGEPTHALHGEVEVRVRDRAGNVSVWRAKGAALPLRVGLEPNYPNPFNPETVIPFIVSPQVGSVRLAIFNATGQMVRELLNGEQDVARAPRSGMGRTRCERFQGEFGCVYL